MFNREGNKIMFILNNLVLIHRIMEGEALSKIDIDLIDLPALCISSADMEALASNPAKKP